MAAAPSSTVRRTGLNDPRAANAPAAKRSESPGKNGVKTSPVSQKIVAKRIRYVRRPNCSMSAARWTSRWRKRSMMIWRKDIAQYSREGFRRVQRFQGPVGIGRVTREKVMILRLLLVLGLLGIFGIFYITGVIPSPSPFADPSPAARRHS